MQKDVLDGGVVEPPQFEDRSWRKKEQEMGVAPRQEAPSAESGEHVPAHHRFREKYFTSFRKEDETTK